MFCGWLGGVLGDLALLYGAQGGIYLAGGVLPQMKDLLVRSTFVERFLDKGAMREVLARTPVRLVEHAQLGVIGAASWYFARHPIDRCDDARAAAMRDARGKLLLEEFHRCRTTKSRRSDARTRARADTTTRGECHDVP